MRGDVTLSNICLCNQTFARGAVTLLSADYKQYPWLTKVMLMRAAVCAEFVGRTELAQWYELPHFAPLADMQQVGILSRRGMLGLGEIQEAHETRYLMEVVRWILTGESRPFLGENVKHTSVDDHPSPQD
jgi:hypothetical protein